MIPSCTVFMCLFKRLGSAKDSLQISQLYGLIPLWIFWCWFKLHLCSKAFLTYLTSMRLTAIMRFLMSSKTFYWSERIVARHTAKWPFCSMGLNVSFEFKVRWKGFVAQDAKVWFLISMSSIMFKKVLICAVAKLRWARPGKHYLKRLPNSLLINCLPK